MQRCFIRFCTERMLRSSNQSPMRKMLTPRKRGSVDHGTMLNVRLRLELGINRQQVVAPFTAMPCPAWKNSATSAPSALLPKLRSLSVTLVEVRALHHVEADTAEQFGHRLGVDGRTEQRRHILLGAADDDEGDAPVGKGIGAGADKAGGWECGDQQAHVPFPLTRNFTSPIRPNPSGQSRHLLVRLRDAGHTSDCGDRTSSRDGTTRRATGVHR